MKSRVILTAIIEHKNKFLLGQKLPDVGPYPNTWHLLGGGAHLESESLKEGLKREIYEESGLRIKKIKRVSFDEDYEKDKKGDMTHYIFLVYWATSASDSIKANDDIHELRWFSKKKLKSIPLTRPSIKLFKELHII